MSVRPALPADFPLIRRLVQTSARTFLRCGLEDLPALLHEDACVLGVDEGPSGRIWGFAAIQRQPRPTTLPEAAPDPATLPVLALGPGVSAATSTRALLEIALARLLPLERPLRIVVLPAENWLISGLKAAGFTEVEQIRFYHRTRREAPQVSGPAHLRPPAQGDLAALAELDRDTFEPLWHMGEIDLLKLCLTCRIQVAEQEGRLVGYTALALHPPAEPFGEGNAQLVRLAVHPAHRRQGIARQLLAESVEYALGQGVHHIHLNTQESNRASQRLYESMHFRRQGRNIPVLIRTVT